MNILLIEDNEDDALLLEEKLADTEEEVRIEHVTLLSKGLQCLADNHFDVVLLDLGLPDSQGLDTVIKTLKDHPELPVVVLTGIEDESLGLRAVQEGAQDYLSKDSLEPHALARTLRYAMERKRMADQMRYAALHDMLTDLPNRTLFMDRLGRVITSSKRHRQHKFAVLFIDLDRFKVVNDSLGHLVGDQLLVQVARRLEKCVRSGDTVARLGGDEFAILLDEIRDVSEVMHVVERIERELTLPVEIESHEIFSGGSIGIAFSSSGYTRPQDILRDADTAMYRAKTSGKNRHEIFDLNMHYQMLSRLNLEMELRQGLQRDEFRVFYLPVVSLRSGRIVGLEALIRWMHPKKGLLVPSDFLSVAEETGLIIPISKWLLRNSCQQLRSWHQRFGGDPPLFLFVNLSGRQLSVVDLQQDIEETLRETGVPPQCLKLEITENLLIKNEAVAIETLLNLKKMGIELYLDDFGTGYSSISCLHRFPLDRLKIDVKIDLSFVTGMYRDDKYAEIVRAVLLLAHELEMEVIAEGVETAQQLAQLRILKCEYAQGYFFSRPMEAPEIETLIAARPEW